MRDGVLKALMTNRGDEVLFYLLDSGEHRYSEIMRDLNIGHSVTLYRSLQKLQDFGLVERADVQVEGAPGSGNRASYAVYRLTHSGAEFSRGLRKYRTNRRIGG